jgi:hypothetical protein
MGWGRLYKTFLLILVRTTGSASPLPPIIFGWLAGWRRTSSELLGSATL